MNIRPEFGAGQGGQDMPVGTAYLGEKYMQLFGGYDHAAFYGGRGSAKSHGVGTVLPVVAAAQTTRVVCARQFQNSIRDSAKELIKQKIYALGLSEQYAIYEREIIHKKYESRFTFIGLDRNPDSSKSLEGADICWVEEARNVGKRALQTLIPSVLRKAGSRMVWTWNPVFPDDPVDAMFRGNHLRETQRASWSPPPNSIVQAVGIEDNPYFYHTQLPAQAEHMRVNNPKLYQHVWLGEYDLSFEEKYSNVKVERVLVPEYVPARYGMDFSQGGKDPHAIVKVYVNLEDRWIYIAREAGGRVSSRELPGLLREVLDYPSELVKADSSQPDLIEILNSEGFNVHGAKKGPGSVKAGITWLQGFCIYIDPDCEQMIEEARRYSWQTDKRTGQTLSAPVDQFNHYWDAVRYATEDCQTEGGSHDDTGGVLKFGFGKRR